MLTYDLHTVTAEPMYYRLYRFIKEDVQRGNLPAGTRLPGKRTFAEHLGVSTVTVDAAYRLLCDEGYVYSRERSGFFVCRIESAGTVRTAAPSLRLASDPPEAPSGEDMGFRYSALAKIMREVISEYGEKLLARPPHFGSAELRNAIAEYLLRYRGMVAQPEQIVIGSGSEYMYGMVALLLGRDRVYGLEDPSYEKIRLTYEAQGASVELLPMGPDGIASEALLTARADVLHVTPFHSFPSGITAPASKRYEYLAWAERRNGFIIEDDFDSEFSLQRKPLETLFAQDTGGRVIYMNTFSHSLAPSMRMGYMLLPEALMEEYRERLGFYYCSVPLFDQLVLARFIGRGHFERHLNRVRRRLKQEKG